LRENISVDWAHREISELCSKVVFEGKESSGVF
jgi:hypothetical protein